MRPSLDTPRAARTRVALALTVPGRAARTGAPRIRAAALFAACSALAALVLAPASPARAATYVIAPGEANLVKFESKAPMESFDGTTHTVAGRITLEPAALEETIAIEVEVDMASLDTGMKLRNQHMCENHLHTKTHPKSVFRGATLAKGAGARLTDGKSHEVVLEGTLDLHGVTKPQRIPATLRLEPAGASSGAAAAGGSPAGAARIRLEAVFDVALADFEIPRPQMLFMKLGETQKVIVSLVAVEAPAGEAAN